MLWVALLAKNRSFSSSGCREAREVDAQRGELGPEVDGEAGGRY